MTYEPAPDEVHLDLIGALHDGGDTIILLGPREPGFWAAFTASAEYADGAPDPLDRYSKRLIGSLARDWGAEAVFPSDGPPFPPFVAWALATGRVWQSPVGLLVYDAQGLWLSFRGAVRVPRHLPLPEPGPNPCQTCAEQPCRTACPVNAFPGGKYDVRRCHAWLDEPENDCMEKGCAVRRSCPASRRYGRLDQQSAFHMSAFHPR